MADPVLAPLESSLVTVRAVETDLVMLLRDHPELPRAVAERLAADAASLRSIGGPTDPNKS